jgi:large subunit ribosomal protein L7/L12
MSEKVTQALDIIKGMSLLEAAELKKALEDEFGVTAAAPMMMAGGMAPGGGEAAAVEEKTEFDVVLQTIGEKKINVIKVVRAHTGLGLKEAKDLVDNAPNTVKEAIPKEEAEKLKKEFEDAGATVTLK